MIRMKNRTHIYVIIAVIAIVIAAGGFLTVWHLNINGEPDGNGRDGAASLEEIKLRGNDYMKQNKVDSAMACYSEIIGKYDGSLDDREKQVCVNAFNNSGYVKFYYYGDFPSAYNDFQKALQICSNLPEEKSSPNIYLNMGNVFAAFDDTAEALASYKQGFKASRDKRKWDTLAVLYSNMVALAFEKDSLPSIKEEMEKFPAIGIPGNVPLAAYSKSLHRAMTAVRVGNLKQAETFLLKARGQIDTSLTPSRFLYQVNAILAKLYYLQGNVAEALRLQREIADSTVRSGDEDVALSALRHIHEYMLSSGDTAAAQKCRLEYIDLLDKKLSTDNLAKIKNLKSNYEISKRDVLVDSYKGRQRLFIMAFIGTALIFIIISVLLYNVISQKKKLDEKNKSLYRKNAELLNLVNASEGKRASVRHVPAKQLKEDAASECAEKGAHEIEPLALGKVSAVFESSDEIFSQNFTLSKFAAVAGLGERDASRIINLYFKKSFTVVLGEYRVREACRRIDRGEYLRMTVEAIAQGVGFKSRTNFVKVFKSVTSLSPTEYIKCSKEEHRDTR